MATIDLKRPRSDTVAPAPLSLPARLPRIEKPSALMHPSDGRRYRCSWVEGGFSVHADGNVTCGLDDPHGRRSFGNINRQTLAEIWANPEYDRLQRKMWNGHKCTECNLAQAVTDPAPLTMPPRAVRPSTLVVEPTIKCNLRCPQPACIPNNDKHTRTRDADHLSLETFTRIADDLAGNLSHVFFYNYGDSFVHAEAEDMLAHLHATSPTAHVFTSTNGIPLAKPERARKVVAAGALDVILFTISGITQETYGRYHVGGRVDLALRGVANVIQAKRELGVDRPAVHLRYLMLNWNDDEAGIDEAIRLSQEMGVDRFSLHLTQIPLDGMSYRFAPGSPNFARYRPYIENALGYTAVSPQPDADGFYGLEQTALGPARWTGWQARKRLRVTGNRARISVSTARPGSHKSGDHVFLLTPWQRVKVPVTPGAWRTVELTVPASHDCDTVEVELVTFDHWFPAETYGGSTDPRCLGVLVLEDGPAADALRPWTGIAPLSVDDVLRLKDFRYRAPEPLVDW